MLKIIEIVLKAKADEEIQKAEKSLASIMNDVLMQYVDDKYREYLSMQMIKPYTQYIIKDIEAEDIYYWRIATLNQEATENIAYRLMDKLTKENCEFITADKIIFQIEKKSYIHSATYKQLVTKYFTRRLKSSYIEFNFLTPTLLFGEEDKMICQSHDIIMNLVAIWNLFAIDEKLHEQDLIENLAQEIQLDDYEVVLRPQLINGKKRPTFQGKCRFSLKNNIMANKIILMLAEFSQYTSIGVNTHLGMGAIQIKLN